jgi:Dolichyl-phosphate-mannose-protein mannosyltransferase
LRVMSPPRFSPTASWVLAGLVLAKLTLHLLTATGYGLHRDEYLYLEMGHHLAWGFKEVPPMLAPLAAISRALGGSAFAVRLWPALFGAATVGLVGWLVRELRGGWWATLLAGLTVAVAPGYLVMHHLFQPNFLELFWWTLYGGLLVRFRHAPRPLLLIGFGAAVGLGLLAKYGTVLYLLALLPAVLLDPVLRPWLLRRPAALAAGTALLIMLPNIGWQIAHDWPVFAHMAALKRNQLGHVAPADFLLDQLGMTLPAAPLWLAGLVFTVTRAGRAYRVLSLTYLFLLALLLLTHGKNYYAAGIYPPLVALGAVALERWLATPHWLARAARGALLLLPLTVVRIFPAVVPVLPLPRLAGYVTALVRDNPQFAGLVRWEDGQQHALPQDVADMRGWPEYAPLAARAWHRLPPSERAHCLIVGDNYGPAGACNWYSTGLHLPPAYSTNGSFSLWWPEPLPDPTAVIYLSEDGGTGEPPDAASWFESAEVIGRIRDPFARCRGSRVWLLRRPKPGVGPWVRGRIAETRAGFDG